MQRLGYDKENNKAIKLNTPFAFPKTLYLDRCVSSRNGDGAFVVMNGAFNTDTDIVMQTQRKL